MTRIRLVPTPRRPALQEAVLRVARRFRSDLEEFAEDHGLLVEWRAGRPTLRCLCAIAAYGLMRALDDAGIHSVFEHGIWGREGSHCWTFVPGAFDVVDVTATQFYRAARNKLTEPVVALDRIEAPYQSRFAGDDALELLSRAAHEKDSQRWIPQTYAHEGYWR